MDKRFQPQTAEASIYQLWLKHKLFKPKDRGRRFSLIMPPPNANGSLHIGHALFVTLEDIMVRMARMAGYSTLMLPGVDHAGIQTQVVFERLLAKKSKSRFDLGYQTFYQACFKFCQDQKETIISQFKKLGVSADWDRLKFTLDPDIIDVVLETFVKLHQDGLIYRKDRLVNWCPRCQTVLSDLEVEHKDLKDKLYYVKYPLVDKPTEFIVIATTRPETIPADTAVAVNPDDKRYKKYVGRQVMVPLINRPVPIIADEAVEIKFGTGAVKVTPAHDPVDFDIGQRHNLKSIRAIGFDDEMTSLTGELVGLSKTKARPLAIKQLDKLGLLVKVEEINHSVGHCERCKTRIEPMVSLQWWIKIRPLAQEAVKAVNQGKIKFVPIRFKKQYLNWMSQIKDWCISRQIWWGPKIPAWYCGFDALSPLQQMMNPNLKGNKGCGHIVVSKAKPKKCPKCSNPNMIQDPDTFDTWFSSSQWPMTTLGFNYRQPTDDFKAFYPTTIMETGYDILYIWVARMIMMGLYMTGQVPFKTVYLHGLIRDDSGQKMSKSKGNVINPIEIMDKYGTDALRIALIIGVGQGEATSVGETKIKAGRYLANKIWNASRFVFLIGQKSNLVAKDYTDLKDSQYKDIWRQHELFLKDYEKEVNKYRFGQASDKLRHQFWHRFCDKTIEDLKDRAYNQDLVAISLLLSLLRDYLALFHPFMPFVTEAVWQVFRQDERFSLIFPTELVAEFKYPIKLDY